MLTPRCGMVLTVAALVCGYSVRDVAAQVPSYQEGKILVVPKGAQGVRVTEFVTERGGEASAGTAATVQWDEEGLVVRFECADAQIVALERERDDRNLWHDDCVDLFLDGGHTHNRGQPWCHVIVSASGNVFDERRMEEAPKKIPGFMAEVQRDEDGWSATITIPWEGLGVRPEPGDVWGMNLNRSDRPGDNYLCWSPTDTFHNITRWGHLVFAAPGDSVELSEEMQQMIDRPHREIEQRYRARLAMYHAPIPDSTPAWVSDARKGLHQFVERHRVEGPVWGLGKRDPSATDWDEVGSCEYVGLVRRYDLEEEAGLTDETRREVIEFWQSWQDPETGRFHDPRDLGRAVNEKYVVGLLRSLGSEPLYAWSTTSTTAGEIETDVFLARSKEDPDWDRGGWGVGSHTGYMAVEIFDAINNDGREELIPDLEQGIEDILSHQGPDGLWGPQDAPLAGRIGGAIKVIGRLYFRLGLKVPRTKELADSLIEYQMSGAFRECSANSCIPRNTAEMIAYCMEASDYRREDLRRAMWACLLDMKEFLNTDGSISNDRGAKGGALSAITYSMGLACAYLGWEDCDWPDPVAGDPRGRGYNYRVVLREDGSIEVVKAAPQTQP